MKVNFQALGCRLNEAELEQWADEFACRGHQLSVSVGDADVIILNTCSVTSEADRKSRQLINRLHRDNPDARLVVTGCYASLQAQKVRSQLGVDLVVANDGKEQLVKRVLESLDADAEPLHPLPEQTLFDRGRHRAFIKVQDGCRYRCTFCIVTVARGDERSGDRRSIVDEVNRHHRDGVNEVVITGVHVGGYGSDSGDSLYGLIGEILDKTTIPRIRLASVEPWDLPANFFELFKDDRLMPHIHLPLQSGSDSVLRRMARRCKTAQFEALVDHARATVPGLNVTTDLIVGFPGETEQEWQETVRFVERVGFGHMHIFSYSPRQGTKAATMSGQVESAVKRLRSKEMHEIAKRLKMAALQPMIGQTCEVLWEYNQEFSDSRVAGYTPNYHKVVTDTGRINETHIGSARMVGVDVESRLLLAEPVAFE